MSDPILVIDIGNTSVSAGLFARNRISHVSRLPTRAGSAAAITELLRHTIGKLDVRGAIIASVVPRVNRVWQKCVLQATGRKPLMVSHKIRLAVPVSYPEPQTIGADRLADASGAALKYGTPVIIADFGTALTFDVVTAKQGYIGGVIAPGLPLMFDYLVDRTALLPRLHPGGRVGRTIGRSTEEAIRSGARWGYLGMVREILARVRNELGTSDVTVCATGGYASWILRGLGEPIVHDPSLTLFGLGKIFELNA